MATQREKDREQEEAMEHAEEIGAKTEGEARAKVKADENQAATAASHAKAGGRPTESPMDMALRALGVARTDVKSYRIEGGMHVVERLSGGPPLKLEASQVYTPQIERALARLGVAREDIKATPGVGPGGVEVPVKGVKVGDERFKDVEGVSVISDGMVLISTKALEDTTEPKAQPRKPGPPVSQDLEAAAIAKAGVSRNDVKSIKREGEEMVIATKDGRMHRVRVATL